MATEPSTNRYFIWGTDESAYGPVSIEVLTAWIGQKCIVPDTWIFLRDENRWLQARALTELKEYFDLPADTLPYRKSFKPGSLRQIKILAELNDAQLAHLSEFLEFQLVKQHESVFCQGEVGHALYLILRGELRARSATSGRETIFTTLAAGECFGEMALFDHEPRSADIIANVDSALLRLSAENFQRLVREAPNLTTPFLQATLRTLSARIRSANKRLTNAGGTEFTRAG